ncbi:MAG: histidine phosphatase family protein [Muribaculaceae bacterium]|nr:histidine phosphatase family protein [Muribaculaceae bacterium]
MLIALFTAVSISAQSELFTAEQCEGSRMPYPVPKTIMAYPDSLTPVLINHVGRHGARYPTSEAKIKNIIAWLEKAEALGPMSESGKALLALSRNVISVADGRWGELDALGEFEQAGIAARMYDAYPMLFQANTVQAEASYVPRCVMSMYAFCHSLTQKNDQLHIIASSGPEYSPLLRPFETIEAFRLYYDEKPYNKILKPFAAAEEPIEVARKAVGPHIRMNNREAIKLIGDIYYLVSSCKAMGLKVNAADYFTLQEYNKMWQVENLRQYLARTSTKEYSLPSEIAVALLSNLVATTQNYIDGTDSVHVHLRFGHAETMLPLVSLLQLPGCYYITDDYNTVASHWQSFNIVPMASNLQMILFKSSSGNYYLRVDLNERPVKFIHGYDDIYVPWAQAKEYMIKCCGL